MGRSIRAEVERPLARPRRSSDQSLSAVPERHIRRAVENVNVNILGHVLWDSSVGARATRAGRDVEVDSFAVGLRHQGRAALR
jgi:hypothetical protein